MQWVRRLKHEVTCCKLHGSCIDHSLSKIKDAGVSRSSFGSVITEQEWSSVVSSLCQDFYHVHTKSNFKHCCQSQQKAQEDQMFPLTPFRRVQVLAIVSETGYLSWSKVSWMQKINTLLCSCLRGTSCRRVKCCRNKCCYLKNAFLEYMTSLKIRYLLCFGGNI